MDDRGDPVAVVAKLGDADGRIVRDRYRAPRVVEEAAARGSRVGDPERRIPERRGHGAFDVRRAGVRPEQRQDASQRRARKQPPAHLPDEEHQRDRDEPQRRHPADRRDRAVGPPALSTAAAVNAVASSAVRQRTPLSVSCWTGVAARMRCMSITTTAQADAACAANVTKVVPVMSTTLNGLAGHAASQSDRTLKTGSRGEVSASTVHAAIITTATAAITRRCPGCSSRPVGNDSDA